MTVRPRAVLASLAGAGFLLVGAAVLSVALSSSDGDSGDGRAAARAGPAVVAPVVSHRQNPVGIWAVENNPIRASDDLFAVRFVLDRATTMQRFITGFNMEGVYTDEAGRPAPTEIRTRVRDKRSVDPRYPAPPAGLPAGWTPGTGRPGYSSGNGGIIDARLVPVAADGTPDLSRVLAEDRVNAVLRYRQSRRDFGVAEITQLLYFEFGGVALAADRPYAVVFSNAAKNPAVDSFSMNSPVTRASVAGPNGRNTLDPNAPGAIAGLDPRESISWSLDGGRRWVWGISVGDGAPFGYYAGSPTSDNGPRLPWYGWQARPGAPIESNQPYYAYGESGAETVVATGAPRATTLTRAGGYAPRGSALGVVTVRNLATGQTGRTTSLGDGLAGGALTPPVRVGVGQSYAISNTGRVAIGEADDFVRSTFDVGHGRWTFTTSGNGADRAQLYALPHPWFVSR